MMNINAILNHYNNTERAYLTTHIQLCAIFQADKAPETDEELILFCDRALATKAAEDKKSAERETTKAIREQKKATDLGMTVDEYREYKKHQAKKTRYAREIKTIEEQIKALQMELEWKKRHLAELEKRG